MTTSTKKTSSTKKGRPVGAKTQDRPPQDKAIQRDPCPHCGSTQEPVKKRLIREGDASGTHRGRAYGSYRMHNANCPACKKAVILREYDYLPE